MGSPFLHSNRWGVTDGQTDRRWHRPFNFKLRLSVNKCNVHSKIFWCMHVHVSIWDLFGGTYWCGFRGRRRDGRVRSPNRQTLPWPAIRTNNKRTEELTSNSNFNLFTSKTKLSTFLNHKYSYSKFEIKVSRAGEECRWVACWREALTTHYSHLGNLNVNLAHCIHIQLCARNVDLAHRTQAVDPPHSIQLRTEKSLDLAHNCVLKTRRRSDTHALNIVCLFSL